MDDTINWPIIIPVILILICIGVVVFTVYKRKKSPETFLMIKEGTSRDNSDIKQENISKIIDVLEQAQKIRNKVLQ